VDGKVALAIAGIAATAVVGVAGAATAWLSASADRSTQRALAHDARVDDRRAAAYLDAIELLESKRDAFELAKLNLGELVPYYRGMKKSLYARVLAFGSNNAISALQEAESSAEEVLNQASSIGGTTSGPGAGTYSAGFGGHAPWGVIVVGVEEDTLPDFTQALAAFSRRVDHFELVARSEVG
jgi:hypothetical protein